MATVALPAEDLFAPSLPRLTIPCLGSENDLRRTSSEAALTRSVERGIGSECLPPPQQLLQSSSSSSRLQAGRPQQLFRMSSTPQLLRKAASGGAFREMDLSSLGGDAASWSGAAVFPGAAPWPPPPLPPMSFELRSRVASLEVQRGEAEEAARRRADVLLEERVTQLRQELSTAEAQVEECCTLEERLELSSSEWRERVMELELRAEAGEAAAVRRAARQARDAELRAQEEAESRRRAAADRYRSLQQQHDDMQDEHRDLHQRHASEQDRHSALQRRHTILDSEGEHLRDDLQRLRSTLDAEQAGGEEVHKQSRRVESELSQARVELDRTQQLCNEHSSGTEDSRERRQMLEDQLGSLRSDMERLQAARDAEAATKRSAQQQHEAMGAELVRVREDIERLQESASAESAARDEVQSSCAAARLERDRAQAQNASRQAEVREAEGRAERMAEEVQRLTIECADARTLTGDGAADAELQQQRVNLAMRQSETTIHEYKLTEERFLVEVSRQDKELGELRRIVLQARTERDQRQTEYDRLKEEDRSKEQAIARLQHQREEDRGRVRVMRKELDTARAEKDAVTARRRLSNVGHDASLGRLSNLSQDAVSADVIGPGRGSGVRRMSDISPLALANISNGHSALQSTSSSVVVDLLEDRESAGPPVRAQPSETRRTSFRRSSTGGLDAGPRHGSPRVPAGTSPRLARATSLRLRTGGRA